MPNKDFDIQIAPDLLNELYCSLTINESTSKDELQSIQDLHDEISKQARSRGSEHPTVLSLLRDLVELYIGIRHFDHAERLLRRLERAYSRTYGPKHIQYIYLSLRLGEMLQQQFRFEEAKERFIRGVEQLSEFFGITNVEDELIGREFVSPIIASQRFITLQGGRVNEMLTADSKQSNPNYRDLKDKENAANHHRRDEESKRSLELTEQKSFKEIDLSREDSSRGITPRSARSASKRDDDDSFGSDTDSNSSADELLMNNDDDGESVSSSLSAFVLPSHLDERFVLVERLYRALARTHQQLHNYHHSERYYKGLLTLYYDTIFPQNPFHRIILESIHALSVVLEAQKIFGEAEGICRQSLADCELFYGPSHSLTLTAMSTLARLLCALKKYDESEAFYHTAIERNIVKNGWRDPLTLSLRKQLSLLYKETHRYKESIEIVEKILLPLAKDVFGPFDIQTLEIYESIGELYGLLRGADALPNSKAFYEQAFEGKAKYYHTRHHPAVYASLFLLGKVNHAMCSWKHRDDYQDLVREAHDNLSLCYRGLMDFYPSLSHSPVCIEISLYYGQFLLQFNRFDEARPVFQKLFAFYEERLSIPSILQPVNTHKRGSAEFVASNSMSSSALLMSPPSSPLGRLRSASPLGGGLSSSSQFFSTWTTMSSSAVLRTVSRSSSPSRLSSMGGLNATQSDTFVISPMDMSAPVVERAMSRSGLRGERSFSSIRTAAHGVVRGSELGVRQGISLNVRNIATPSQPGFSAFSSSRQFSSRISTAASHDRYSSSIGQAHVTVRVDYSDHPIAALQLPQRAIKDALAKLTIPELLIYADTCYQLALIAGRKKNYCEGQMFFSYAYTIFAILLRSPHFASLPGRDSSNTESHSAVVGSVDYEEPNSQRSIANGLFIGMMDNAAVNQRSSGMSSIPTAEKYFREDIEQLKADALEQVNHAEYLARL